MKEKIFRIAAEASVLIFLTLLLVFVSSSLYIVLKKERAGTQGTVVWRKEVICKETQMRNFCYCAGDNSCSFTEKCDVAEKAGFDVIYYGKDVFK